ncbi:rhodanase domain containing protein [Nitzschia inconspicua]|uniref:Rhodanase domain containing protein n=1 Tax=Nitzschia inconspicua TaxID=303405 RepID=A0A9K3M1U1_9STRA|nr:rhodanase domain containing protein [Nitzschia inconspicua]
MAFTATSFTDNENGDKEVLPPTKRRRLSKRQRKGLKKKRQRTKQDSQEEMQEDSFEKEQSSEKEEDSDVDTTKPLISKTKKGKQDYENSHDIRSAETSLEDEDDEAIRHRCMKTYQAIEIPSKASPEILKTNAKGCGRDNNSNTDTIADEGGCRTLGKWFPNAILVKSRLNYTNTGKLILLNEGTQKPLQEQDVRVNDPKSSLVLFYQYTTSSDSTATAPWDRTQLQLLMTYLTTVARQRNLGGRIRVAPEGVNATISAVDTQQYSAQETLRHFAKDLQRFDPKVFLQTDFKYLDHLPADRHFKEFKIMPVQELVFYDIGEDEAPLQQHRLSKEISSKESTPVVCGGVHLEAKEYHEMLKKDNTVVIDVRNHYETILGRFDGQQQQNDDVKEKKKSTTTSGAEYIDPKMRKSTDFKSWLATPETKEKLQNKTVLMYCTGGIRCERASAYLKSKMGDQVEGVYQLKGGIERYLKTFKDGGFWRGKNFVFDKREAVGVENPEGDGGVIRKQAKKKKASNSEEKLLPAKCCVCGNAWDRYVGKKKCSTCGVPVLMCDKCMSLKPDKTPGMELKVRCPLCVEENITVLAKEVEFTDNGIKSKTLQTTSTDTLSDGNAALAKAADSVLKWGGGHANKKKQRKKMKRIPCQFGSECVRADCFFYHPGKEAKKNEG